MLWQEFLFAAFYCSLLGQNALISPLASWGLQASILTKIRAIKCCKKITFRPCLMSVVTFHYYDTFHRIVQFKVESFYENVLPNNTFQHFYVLCLKKNLFGTDFKTYWTRPFNLVTLRETDPWGWWKGVHVRAGLRGTLVRAWRNSIYRESTVKSPDIKTVK